MAAILLDHNVAHAIAPALRERGHDVVTARELGGVRASDDEHLLVAAQQGRVLVTCDVEDFVLLHGAWLRWFAAYPIDPTPTHAGILIIPQPDPRRGLWLPDHAAREIDAFLAQGRPLANRLFLWTTSRGWVQR